tara:strand:+ start:711 stop:2405 length:1695 start_codon:yes stop_codon:yes gene_type:complete
MAKDRDEQLSDLLGGIDIDALGPEDISDLYTFTQGFEGQDDEFADRIGSAFEIAGPALESGLIEPDPYLMMTSPNWPFRYTDTEPISQPEPIDTEARIGELSMQWKENGNRWHAVYNPDGIRGPHDPPASVPTFDDIMDPSSTNKALAEWSTVAQDLADSGDEEMLQEHMKKHPTLGTATGRFSDKRRKRLQGKISQLEREIAYNESIVAKDKGLEGVGFVEATPDELKKMSAAERKAYNKSLDRAHRKHRVSEPGTAAWRLTRLQKMLAEEQARLEQFEADYSARVTDLQAAAPSPSEEEMAMVSRPDRTVVPYATPWAWWDMLNQGDQVFDDALHDHKFPGVATGPRSDVEGMDDNPILDGVYQPMQHPGVATGPPSEVEGMDADPILDGVYVDPRLHTVPQPTDPTATAIPTPIDVTKGPNLTSPPQLDLSNVKPHPSVAPGATGGTIGPSTPSQAASVPSAPPPHTTQSGLGVQPPQPSQGGYPGTSPYGGQPGTTGGQPMGGQPPQDGTQAGVPGTDPQNNIRKYQPQPRQYVQFELPESRPINYDNWTFMGFARHPMP